MMGSQAAARIGLIGAVVALGIAAFLNAASNVIGLRNPYQAVNLPWAGPKAVNGVIDRELGTQRFDRGALQRLAERSLALQLLNPPAVRTIGLLRALAGKPEEGERAVAVAERMSRRDLGTQLWLIERGVARQDLPEVLRHYDIALRSSRASSQLLYPILTQAIADPAIRAALKPYVRRPAAWMPQFLLAASYAGRVENAAKVVLDAGAVPPGRAFAAVSGSLIPNLATLRRWDTLRSYYRLTPGADATLLTSTAFTPATTRPDLAPLSWAVTQEQSLFGQFQVGERGSAEMLAVSAEGSSSGWAAQKILYLPARAYRLSVAYGWTDASEGAQAAVALYCGDNQGGEPLVRVPMERSGSSAAARVSVPATCPAQALRVEVRGGFDGPMAMTVQRIAIAPAGG